MKRPIGVYGISNTAGLAVYEYDYCEDKVLVGVNDQDPEWCDVVSGEGDEHFSLGFKWGELFVPFDQVYSLSSPFCQ